MASFQIKHWHEFNFSVIHPCSLNQVLTTKLNTILEKNTFGETEKSTGCGINSGSDLKRKEEQQTNGLLTQYKVSVEGAVSKQSREVSCIANGLAVKGGEKEPLPRRSSELDNAACYRGRATTHNQTKGGNL